MLINSQIFNQVVSDAKAKSANNPALLRAIDRAVFEILHAAYWSFVAGVLRIQSTTSRKLYVVDDSHTCEAKANGHKFCKHTVARRLMTRYVERLGASEVTGETKAVRNWQAGVGHTVVETKRVVVSDARGVKEIRGEVRRKPSMLDAARNVPLLKRTASGEKYGAIDV
jgi:hypothetical protein